LALAATNSVVELASLAKETTGKAPLLGARADTGAWAELPADPERNAATLYTPAQGGAIVAAKATQHEQAARAFSTSVAFREALQDDSQMAAAGVHLGAMLQITGQIQD
jgi:hypothetical protein